VALAELRPLKGEYQGIKEYLVDVHKALNMYASFHLAPPDAGFVAGKDSVAMQYATRHSGCACKRGCLLTSLFKPEIAVPKAYVAFEPGLHKKYHMLKGTAGPKRMCLLAELKKDK
jgi:hypothetical protein